MVYEHFSVILEDPSSGFSKIFQTVVVVAHGDIPRLVALVLGDNILLAMAKDSGGFHPIIMGKMFFQPINRSIVL
jgi:hypothetical protein